MAQDVFGIAGTTQGPFTIEEAVAEGGFGVVYRAHHGAFRAPVALKCLKIPTIPVELRAEFLERFREEAELLFRLSATIPEVVRPLHYDVVTLDSGLIVPFIALEWLDGHTLWSLIEQRAAERRAPLGVLDAVRILTPVARALEVAHNFPGPSGPLCVVHRDIKPANIFLAEIHGAEYVKILDFGIARARDAASIMAGQMTQSGPDIPPAFTPRYGAPEQWAPKRFGTTGPWTDVWGLAVSFLETIAGRAVIDGDAVAIMGTVLDEKRRPTPRAEGVQVSDALEAVFRRALAVDPRERPSSAGVFWDEVEQALGLGPRASMPTERRSGTMRAPVVDGGLERRRSSGSLRAVEVPAPSLDVASTALAEVVLPVEGGSGASRLPDAPRAGSNALSSAIDVDWGEAGPNPPKRKSSSSLPAIRVDPPPSQPSRISTPSEPPPSLRSVDPEPAPDVRSMLGVPVALASAGALLRVVDLAAGWLWLGDERIRFGPLRLAWIAALFIGAGAILALARLLRHLAR